MAFQFNAPYGVRPRGPVPLGGHGINRALAGAYLLSQSGGINIWNSVGRVSGTLSGATIPTWTAEGLFLPGGTSAQSYVNAGTPFQMQDLALIPAATGQRGWSFVARIKMTGANGTQIGLAERNDGNTIGRGWAIGFNGSSPAVLVEGTTTDMVAQVGIAGADFTNKWTVIAGVMDGTLTAANQVFYINGVKCTSNGNQINGSGNNNTSATDTLFLFRNTFTTSGWNGNNCWQGYIDVIYFWRRMLTNPEVVALSDNPYLPFWVPASHQWSAAASGTITSCTPNQGQQSEVSLDLLVIGANNAWVQGTTVASFSGAGITVNSTTINDSNTAVVNVTIAAGAATGARDLTMTTGAAAPILAGAFTVHAPSTIKTVKRNGFQYTSLARNSDFRLTPIITIRKSLNQAQNNATLVIDGNSNIPKMGEVVTIVDAQDGNRTLFGGEVITFEQNFEGKGNQLAWTTTITGFRYMLNKYFPFGKYVNKACDQVVLDLMAKFAPLIGTGFVQTNLGPITIELDGTKDMATVLSDLCTQIGGGHWYVDDNRVLHFFHKQPVITDFAGAGALAGIEQIGSPMTLSVGQLIPSVSPYGSLPGFYILAHTFVYSDGTESALQAWSNVVFMDGLHQFSISNLPIGANVGNTTCTKRRIYMIALQPGYGTLRTAQKFCEVTDNTTTSFTTWYGQIGASTTAVVAMAASVVPPTVKNNGNPPGPSTASVISLNLNFGQYYQNGGAWQVKVAFLYQDGSISMVGPASNVGFQPMILGQGIRSMTVQNIPIGPTVGGVACIARLIYFFFGDILVDATTQSLGSNIYPEDFAVIEDNTTTSRTVHMAAAGYAIYNAALIQTGVVTVTPVGTWLSPLQGGQNTFNGIPNSWSGLQDMDPTIVYYDDTLAYGSHNDPANGPFDAQGNFDPIPPWPNQDGPDLEATLAQPTALPNSQLLRTPQIKSTVDISQLRNRVNVRGSGSTLTADVTIGQTNLPVADVTAFSIRGGTILIGGAKYPYATTSGVKGNGQVQLATKLQTAYPAGEPLVNFLTVDDVNSQAALGAAETDTNGNPTDGVHEFTVVDNTFKARWQLQMRANAELEVFSKPIVSIEYWTEDPNSLPGRTVHVDMSSPPIQGDFLIQETEISHEHGTSYNKKPTYHVKASSSKYNLSDLLLLITGAKQSSSTNVGVGGIAPAPNANGGNFLSPSGPFPVKRFACLQIADDTTPVQPTLQGIGCSAGAPGGTFTFDTAEIPAFTDNTGAMVDRSWGTVGTSAQANTSGAISMTNGPVNRIENGFDFWVEIKTPVDMTNILLWVGLTDALSTGAVPVNNSTLMFRYSNYSGNVDSGWSAFIQPAGVSAPNIVRSVASIAPSTKYLLRIQASMPGDFTTASATFTAIGGGLTQSITIANQTVGGTYVFPVGLAEGGPSGLLPYVFVVQQEASKVKKINFRRMFVSTD